LPKTLLGTIFYHPSQQGYEAVVRERLESWRKAQREALGIQEVKEIPELNPEEIREIKTRHKSGGRID